MIFSPDQFCKNFNGLCYNVIPPCWVGGSICRNTFVMFLEKAESEIKYKKKKGENSERAITFLIGTHNR